MIIKIWKKETKNNLHDAMNINVLNSNQLYLQNFEIKHQIIEENLELKSLKYLEEGIIQFLYNFLIQILIYLYS